MPRYHALYLLEINEDNKSDSRIIVLYDSEVDKYFYYGTRSRYGLNNANINIDYKPNLQNEMKYIQFAGAYPSEKLATFVSFLGNMTDHFDSKFIVEMYAIEMEEDEYDGLTFDRLHSKFSKYNELFAYDNVKETEGSIMEKIDMLTCEVL